MPSKFFFRARGFPSNATVDDLEHALKSKQPELLLNTADVSIVPSCPYSPEVKTVLFSVAAPVGEPLLSLVKKKVKSITLLVCGKDVAVDTNFYGFTQMYPTAPGDHGLIIADIIALTGINSHAYGSWKAKSAPERMWLRDFMAKEFPNCRTMTYGYNADLKEKSVHKSLEFIREFLLALKSVRKSKEERKRPIIFIGHSYGGLLIAHTLVKAKLQQVKFHDELDCLLKSVAGVIFFGTPHRGMLIQNLVDALQAGGNTQRLGLLDEIQQHSRTLEQELKKFIDLCPSFKICSVYEMDQTPLVAVDEHGNWIRDKKAYALAVEDTSSLLQLPETMEVKIPANADHSNMVKFETAEDNTYKAVCEFIATILSTAKQDISNRFEFETASAIRASGKTIFQVPMRRNDYFGGREKVLADLEKRLTRSASDATQPLVSLCALGGSGKTEIAVEFCYRRQSKYLSEHVFWIYGDSFERFSASYREILRETGSSTTHDEATDLRTVQDWLERDVSGNWIMVIDNIDDVDIPIDKYLPRKNGAILFTTRDHRIMERFKTTPIDIGTIDREDAVRMFFKLIQVEYDSVPDPSVEELVDFFGCLPLAIAQAAVYIREVSPPGILDHEVISDYISQIRGREATYLSKSPSLDSDRKDQQSRGAMNTWTMTFEKLKTISLESIRLLQLLSFLDPDQIPKTLLTSLEHPGLKNDGISLNRAIQNLTRFSLLMPIKGNSFRIHRLVSLFTRETTRGSRKETIRILLSALVKLFPDGFQYENAAQCAKFVTHVLSVLEYTPEDADELRRSSDWITLNYHVAGYHFSNGNYQDALKYFGRALTAQNMDRCDSTSEGTAHHSLTTAATTNRIGMTLEKLSRHGEALEHFQSALGDRTQHLRTNHPDTLETVHNIGNAHLARGDYEKAMESYQLALSGRETELRSDHPDTLRTRNCIANVYFRKGDYDNALKSYEEVLRGRKRALKENHPDIFHTVHNIANVLRDQGKFNEAMEQAERAYHGLKESLGESHPDTLRFLFSIGRIYGKQLKDKQALGYFKDVYEKQRKLLGDRHHHTLETIGSIASVLDDQGKYEESMGWYQLALEGKKDILGEQHQDTLITISNMANLYQNQGQSEQALEWYQRALSSQETVLSPNHPDTLRTLLSMANVYQALKKETEALSCLERVQKGLSPEHPEALSAKTEIANIRFDQGEHKIAISLYQEVLQGMEKTLGEEHLHTLIVVYTLGRAYEVAIPTSLRDYDQAIRLYQRTAAWAKKNFGEEDDWAKEAEERVEVVTAEKGKDAKEYEREQREKEEREKEEREREEERGRRNRIRRRGYIALSVILCVSIFLGRSTGLIGSYYRSRLARIGKLRRNILAGLKRLRR